MSKFSVDEVVDDLSYDFSKFVPGAKGAIPEPTSAQLEEFTRRLTAIAPTKDGEVDYGKLAARLQADDDQGLAVLGEMIGAFAHLCGAKIVKNEDGTESFEGGSPSADELRRLGEASPRAIQAFIGWILGEFFGGPKA